VKARARAALLIALAVAMSCSRERAHVHETIPHNPLPAGRPLTEADERASLINIARGTAVVDRTGEALFDVSAINTIDGDYGSYWLTPPHDFPQSVTLSLPARSRIDRVGIRTMQRASLAANHVQFETSLDGKTWKPLTTIQSSDTPDAQWFDVPAAEARQMRVTLLDSVDPQRDVRLHSILARGTELEPPRLGSIDGCWALNGRAAAFSQRASHVLGALAIGNQPLYLDGGTDGRLYRFVWIRGNDYGLAAVAVAPGGKRLSAMEWHEEAIPMFLGEPWFGERGTCAAPELRTDVPLALLRRVGRYSAFGLRFKTGDSLDPDESRDALDALVRIIASLRVPARIVVHELREPTPAANKARAERELASVRSALAASGADLRRVTFVAAGSDAPRQQPVTEIMRTIYSSVDLEIQR